MIVGKLFISKRTGPSSRVNLRKCMVPICNIYRHESIISCISPPLPSQLICIESNVTILMARYQFYNLSIKLGKGTYFILSWNPELHSPKDSQPILIRYIQSLYRQLLIETLIYPPDPKIKALLHMCSYIGIRLPWHHFDFCWSQFTVCSALGDCFFSFLKAIFIFILDNLYYIKRRDTHCSDPFW